MPRAKKGQRDELVESMNRFAGDLLKQAEEGKTGDHTLTFTAKMDIFVKVAAWIGVRNRIEDQAEGGSELDGYRSRLTPVAGAADQRKKSAPNGFRDFESSARGGRAGMATRLGRPPPADDEDAGSGIAALKSRIPQRDDAGDGLDFGGDAGDAGAVDAGTDRGVRPGAADRD